MIRAITAAILGAVLISGCGSATEEPDATEHTCYWGEDR